MSRRLNAGLLSVQCIVRRAALQAMLLAATVTAASGSMDVSRELDVEFGYGGGATTLQNRQRAGSVSELATDVKYVVSPQITNNLLLRVGAEWERFGFSTPRSAALPDALQQVSAIIGCDYQLADRWLMRAEAQPGVYGDLRQVGWRNFGAPLVLGLVFLQDADLQWFFGLRIDTRSGLPLVPAAGVRWKFADLWTLNLQLPKPRLEYDLNDNLQAFAGAGIKAGTFTVGDHFGTDHGFLQLNNATVDYTELRVGPGFSWKILPNLTLEAEGGCMLSRTWDFFDNHVKLNSRPAPYLQLSGHARF